MNLALSGLRGSPALLVLLVLLALLALQAFLVLRAPRTYSKPALFSPQCIGIQMTTLTMRRLMASRSATTRIAIALIVLLVVAEPAQAQEGVLSRPEVENAFARIEADYARYVELQIKISQVPAPPFREAERALFMRDQFRARGIDDAHIDDAGNVIALRPGSSDRTLVLSAHLDTVWPIEVDVTVQRDGTRLTGPGILDDAVGLVSLLGILDALNSGGFETEANLLFVGTVGEEGIGDLKGVKHLFRESPFAGSIDAFVSIDGAGPARIVTGATASKRYRVTVSGPGGHSYGAFGIVNPAHALGNIIARFTSMPVPSEPKTTYSIGRIGGGTSVNTIPDSVWMEVDMRSTSNETLGELERRFLAAVEMGVAEENLFRSASGTALSVDPVLIGDRPTGQTGEDSAIYRAAAASSELVGFIPSVGTSSTDSNIPMSMGIPAVTVGGGGRGGGAHRTEEWYDFEDAHLGLQRLLAMVLLYDEFASTY